MEPLRHRWTTHQQQFERMARKVEEMAQQAHPKIFTLMVILKDIQNAKDILLRIQMLIERYQDGIIDLMTSTDTASELLQIG